MRDDLIEIQPKWKMTSMDDDLNRRQPDGGRTQWKTNSMEDDLNGKLITNF